MERSELFEKVLRVAKQKERRQLREMALMGFVEANPRTLPRGMRIEVITTEFQGTGEEPHFHLFPANHRSRDGSANNYDLITRVALTEESPESPQEIHAIEGNDPVPRIYQKAIFKWSQEDHKNLGVNNWDYARSVWDDQAATVRNV